MSIEGKIENSLCFPAQKVDKTRHNSIKSRQLLEVSCTSCVNKVNKKLQNAATITKKKTFTNENNSTIIEEKKVKRVMYDIKRPIHKCIMLPRKHFIKSTQAFLRGKSTSRAVFGRMGLFSVGRDFFGRPGLFWSKEFENRSRPN